jgi:hypothetical protein
MKHTFLCISPDRYQPAQGEAVYLEVGQWYELPRTDETGRLLRSNRVRGALEGEQTPNVVGVEDAEPTQETTAEEKSDRRKGGK